MPPKTPEVALCPVELQGPEATCTQNGPQNAPKYAIKDPKITKKILRRGTGPQRWGYIGIYIIYPPKIRPGKLLWSKNDDLMVIDLILHYYKFIPPPKQISGYAPGGALPPPAPHSPPPIQLGAQPKILDPPLPICVRLYRPRQIG